MSCQSNKEMVRFEYLPDETVKKVFLAGSFNNWQPLAMSKKNGRFVRNLKIPPGTHEYKYIVDGVWMLDPDHNNHRCNSLGTLNSVVVVE